MKTIMLAALAVVTACSSGADLPQATGLDGLRAHLAEARKAPARAVASWTIPADTWRELVTDAYADHWDGYAQRMRAEQADLTAALAASADGAPRTHYADDPAISDAQVRLRWVLPVGQPGAVVDGIPAVFVHDGAAWRAIVSLDPIVTAMLPEACADAYLDGSTKPCQEWAWEIAEAALRGGDPARACGNARAIGCGAAR